jgi:hypothetical protein
VDCHPFGGVVSTPSVYYLGMSNADTATRRPAFYAIAVRGDRGRKWFRADSAQCGDLGFMERHADVLNAEYAAHGVRFAAMDTREIPGAIAPRHYRPWDTDEDETDEDTDLDALTDDEL